MSLEQVGALREQLYDAGFRSVPVLNGDKRPLGKEWTDQARLNPPACITYGPVAHALSTGILCDGLRAVDYDIEDKDIAAKCRAIGADIFGEAPMRFRRNSARFLVLYRALEGAPPKAVLAGKHGKIEALGKGQQFVAFGTHPSGAEYEWFPDAPGTEKLQALPAISEDQLFEFFRQCTPIIEADPPQKLNGYTTGTAPAEGSALEIAAALAVVPNNAPPNWEWWNSVGMAIWRSCGGADWGFELWNDWSTRHPSYSATETRKRWEHYPSSPPNQTGLGKLLRMAREAPKQAKEPDQSEQQQGDASETPTDKNGKPIFPVEYFADISLAADCQDFIEGVLIERAMSVIYGESNSGKTFFATDMAFHIAAGWTWAGRAVDRGAVIYCALEGGHGIRNRIFALKQHYSLTDYPLPLAIVPVSINMLDLEQDINGLIRTIHHVKDALNLPVKITFMDTLSRALAGGNENAPDDMGALVSNGTRIQQETGSHLSWIHHSGKDQAKGARGHSLLRAATDTEIEVFAEGPQRIARVTKQRDLECSGEFTFQLKVVELGINRRGKPITSCVVDYGDDAALGRGQAAGAVSSARRHLSGHNKRALEVLIDLCAGSGQSGHPGTPSGVLSVPEKWWRDRFYDRAMPGAEIEAKKKAFQRASLSLINSHLVGMVNQRVWIVQPGVADNDPKPMSP